MLDRFQGLVWRVWSDGRPGRIWKIVASHLLASVILGFLLAAILLAGHDVTIVGHPGLFVSCTVMFTLLAGLGGLVLFRQLLYGMLRERLAELELRGHAARNIVEHSMYRLSLVDLVARIRELLNEEVLAAGNVVQRRHVVGGQYGLAVPAGQLDKILEDEGFYGLHGRSRDAFVIVPLCHFPAAEIHSLDGKSFHELFQPVLKKSLELSRHTGFLFADFCPRFSLLCSDLPYASEKRERLKLPADCRKWRDAVGQILESRGTGWGASVILHHGAVHGGLLPVGDTGQYRITGPAVSYALGAGQRLGHSGLYLSAEALAQLKLERAPDGWDILPETVPSS